jgi:hypothetical protein
MCSILPDPADRNPLSTNGKRLVKGAVSGKAVVEADTDRRTDSGCASANSCTTCPPVENPRRVDLVTPENSDQPAEVLDHKLRLVGSGSQVTGAAATSTHVERTTDRAADTGTRPGSRQL